MTVAEAWTELAPYVPTQAPQEQVDQADLVTAMERTPGQVVFVSGHDELRRILAYPFAAWRIFLDPRQRKIAYQPSYNGPAQVTGGAGTGKTVTALHRAAYLTDRQDESAKDGQHHDAAGPPILLTTFTRNLAESLAAQLSLLVEDDQARARIEVINVDRLAYRILPPARAANPP